MFAAVVRLLELTLDPGRQRRVRAAQPVVRPDDPANPTRGGSRPARPLPVPGQGRSDARGRHRATGGWRRVVGRCQDLPGQELFQYVDEDGETRDVTSDDVNDYIREISGGDFTAKDFRTWAGTVLAYRALRALEPAGSETDARRNVVAAIRVTAGRLGNTPAVARKSYVHPAVLEAYLDGRVGGALVEAAEEQAEPPPATTPEEERAVVRLLGQKLDAAGAGGGTGKRAKLPPRSRK